MAKLLLHSLNEFDEIILSVMRSIRPTSVLEIGSETGVFSQRLMALCHELKAQLHIIEPFPIQELIDATVDSEELHVYVGLSLDVLAQVPIASEVVLIDGDHNYFTVRNELELLSNIWQANQIEGVMLMHDVHWPCARRDQYYNPAVIPEEARHPYSFDQGITVGQSDVINGGFRGEGAFAFANHEGGPRNGVLTAVEDFLKAHPEYCFRSIEAVFGLGAITLRDTAADRIIEEAFAPYDNGLVKRLERNRLELYLKVIELQDQLNATREELSQQEEKLGQLQQAQNQQQGEMQLLQQAQQLQRLRKLHMDDGPQQLTECSEVAS